MKSLHTPIEPITNALDAVRNNESFKSLFAFLLSEGIITLYLLVLIIWFVGFLYKVAKSYLVEEKLDEGVAALHKATFLNETALALELTVLFPYAINVPVKPDQWTPFLRACYHGNTPLVKLMIKSGADIKSRNIRGENGIYLVTYNMIRNKAATDATCIHALFHAGVDINTPNNNGRNALQLASLYGHTSLARWLVGKGACFNVHPTPYELAKKAGCREAAAYLKELHLLTKGGNTSSC